MRPLPLAPLLFSLALAAPAAAQDVVVLSVGGDAPEADARVAREAVAAALAADGLAVLEEANVALRVPPSRLRECRDPECAWALGRELGVPMVAAVATWSGDPGSLTLSLIVGESRSHTATEELAEGGLTAAARAAVAAAQGSRRRALLVEGTSAPPPEEAARTATEREIESGSPLTQDRSLEQWILPSILGVVGLALVGTSVYALLDQQCELRGPSGTCLRGTDPNVGLGVVMAVLGGLSVGGAILWLVVGGQPMQVGRIDVVLGPGNVGVRGTF